MVVCSALAALFVVVLWPSRSFAAIVPACENDFFSGVLAAQQASTEEVDESCDTRAANSDDIDNSRAAPICDARGASAIAPPRVRGIADVRMERQRPCESNETVRAAVSPDRGDPPAQPPQALVERAVMPSLELLVPVGEARLIESPPVAGGPAAGVRRDVYHPPR